MLTRIDLRHFKCFETLKLPLCALTLLSGANASGKSSVMQALVLLHQTMREHEWSSRLMLNGSAVRLGAVADVVDQVHGRRDCGIALLDDDAASYQWEFEGERDEMSMALRRARGETGAGDGWDVDGSQPFHHLLPAPAGDQSLTSRLRKLTYLTAERLGPRELYAFDDPQLTPVVGPRGEYAVSVLHSGRDVRVLDSLAIDGVPPTRFRQVEARMARFFPGCVLAVEQVPGANAATLGIRISADTDFHRPVHTGFGLTQVLPIVVAGLSADEDDLLLIENPEVHLHPAGQAAMGEFLSEVASAGVQVVIETHSDHILNGIRRAVKGGMLVSGSVALHFFRPRLEDPHPQGGAQVESPILDADGNIDSWPDGFFDQFDRDMNYFADWS
ncbi:MAG: DUF3696 domain-containing protein [Acidobacteria bacterium]|nr:DUF3696 domain-containing protein [Acidobacteriota bacterium]